MRYLLLSLLLIGCAPARAEEPKAQVQRYQPKAHDVEVAPGVFITPFDFLCGNGNTYCADSQICYNGNCLTICGSHECFIEMETAYDNATICPSDPPPQDPPMTSWQRLKRMKHRQ